jgi:hypothetical protein
LHKVHLNITAKVSAKISHEDKRSLQHRDQNQLFIPEIAPYLGSDFAGSRLNFFGGDELLEHLTMLPKSISQVS